MSAAEVSPLLPRAPRSLQDLLYHQGQRYALYHGDSLQLMDQMEPESFDLVFAYPPYFLSNGGFTCKAGRRAPVEKGGWDRSRGVDVDHAFTIRWLKASPNLSCRYFTHSTELLIWAAPRATDRLQHTFNYADMKAQNGGKQMRDLWQMTTPKKSEKEFGRHPTQKPLQLLLRIIQASTHEGDRVLDPFNGSGTTGVAALHLGRRYTGVDIDAAYLATTRKRLEATRDLKSL